MGRALTERPRYRRVSRHSDPLETSALLTLTRVKVGPIVVAGALLITACADSGADPDGSPPADLVVAAVEGLRWERDSYSAGAGDLSVVLDNRSSLPHNLYFVARDGTELPVSFEAGPRRTTEPDELALAPGTYTLICTLPGHGSMKATLTVA